jgi:glycerol-3-phosphate dehydrogenase
LALAQTAAEKGATVANHLEITGFEKDAAGNLIAAHARDTLTGEEILIRAKVFINCTGPYADHIRILASENLVPRIRPSKGVHAILPYDVLGGDDALLIPKTPDGRVVFAIPFYGKLMLGTTDTEYSEHEMDKEPQLEAEEVDFLLETLQPYLDRKVLAKQVVAGFGGLRPLISSDPAKGTKGLVRDHEVEYDKDSKLVSLLGGKWTTYRLMAKDTIDFVGEHLLDNQTSCKTADQILTGGENFDPDGWQALATKTGLNEATSKHLHSHYGSRINELLDVLAEKPAWREPLVADYPYLTGEAVYAARREMAGSVRDFIARRIRLEILDWDAAQQAAGKVARAMGAELGWSEKQQLTAAEDYIDQLYEFREMSQP